MLPVWIALLCGAWAGDAPEISRSVGEEGGVVVLWPRVIPKSTSQLSRASAFLVNQELQRIAGEVLKGRPLDARPEPERVCPQSGCTGIAIGAVLVHSGEACVAVATVSAPGRSAQTLIPWVGVVELAEQTVPFREPPESFVKIKDFGSCRDLKQALHANAEGVRAAVAAAAGVSLPARTGSASAPTPLPVPAPAPATPSPAPIEGW